MLATVRLVLAAAALLLVACSSDARQGDTGGSGGSAGGVGGVGGVGGGGVAGAGAPDGGSDAGGTTCAPHSDEALIVPEGLGVSLEPGGAGVLDLYALTLQDGPNGLELYAALRNDGEVLACDAALKVQLFDTAGQPLGEWISGLYTKHFYLYTLTDDGSTTIAACASPGDVTMTEVAITASDIALSEVGSVVYYYSYFALDAVPIDGLIVNEVNTVTTNAGTSYTGTVINDLDMMVSDPSVTVFPLNCVGRPLGIASGSATSAVPAGGSWTFQTSTVDTPGVNYAAYPAASF